MVATGSSYRADHDLGGLFGRSGQCAHYRLDLGFIVLAESLKVGVDRDGCYRNCYIQAA
jgi:hypothetical protein